MANYPSQDSCFYTEKWPQDNVDILINHLAISAEFGLWEYGTKMSDCVKDAVFYLSASRQAKYEIADVYEAIEMLFARFQVWESLKSHPLIAYNSSQNMVYATKDAWQSIVEADERTKWYFWSGEPRAEQLRVIFAFKPLLGDFGDAKTIMNNKPRNSDGDVSYALNQFVHPNISPEKCVTPQTSLVDLTSPSQVPRDASSPYPLVSPEYRVISKDEFARSLSAKGKGKSKKKLFGESSSPASSVGSSPQPPESNFGKIKRKFFK